MDLRERALAAHREHDLEHEHDRHKDEAARAQSLADRARRTTIDVLELEGEEVDDLRAMVTPGERSATVLVNDLPAFYFGPNNDLRTLHECPECGATVPHAQRVTDLAGYGQLIADHPSRLELLDHERRDDPTWHCNGLRSWSTVQQPPKFLAELVNGELDGSLGISARVAASLGRMAAATANPAAIYPGPHGWLIVARVDPDPPAYTGDDAF